jgi:EmrB/QacA subfamily drug resistance transporter
VTYLIALRSRLTEQRVVATVYAISMFISTMDTQIVNVALAPLGVRFGVSTASVQWLVTGYLMSIAVCVPASGWLGDRFGTKRIYLTAVGTFTVASALCAVSTNLGELIGFRVLQGAGGGMMVPTGMAMLYRAYEPGRHVRVARLIIRIHVLAPISAPLIGGALLTYASWRWIFTINVPFGIAVCVFGWLFLKEHRESSVGSFDLVGFVLAGAGLGMLLYSVGAGPTAGWASAQVVISGVSGATFLVLFVIVELRRSHPILKLRLLRDRMFRRCCTLIAFSSTGFLGALVFTGLYLQQARGYSAIASGLTTFPEAIGVAVGSQIAGRLFPRIGPRRLIAFGFAGLLAMNFAMSHVDESTTAWTVRVLCLLIGFFASYIMISSQGSAFTRILPADSGHAAAIFSTLQRALSSIGIAVLSTVLALSGGDVVVPPASSFRAVFLVSSALAAVGVIIGLRIRDSDLAMATRRAPTAETVGVVGDIDLEPQT